MTQKDEKAKTDRRSFLKLAGAGAVGGAAALVSAADEADLAFSSFWVICHGAGRS